jgi:hypothetical protein
MTLLHLCLKSPSPRLRHHFLRSVLVAAPSWHAPSARVGGPVVEMSRFSTCGGETPRQRLKPPWEVLSGKPCTCGGVPLAPAPPQPGIAPSVRCSYGAHPNSQLEMCVKLGGVVIGCNPLSVGDAPIFARCFLNAEYHIKVVKSVKMKPPEVTLLQLLSIRVVQRSPRWDALSSCRSPRKSEWRCPQLARRHARLASSRLGLLLLSVGRTECHE